MENKIDVVITMGGLGSRFREAGYNVPKYMIEVKGRTLFEWSMISLQGYRNNVDKYIFVVMKDNLCDVENFIKVQCEKLQIKTYYIIMLDYLTDGQATTAMMAAKYWNSQNALLIYNIDTYVVSGEMNSSQIKGDGFIPCFHADGDHWSFVKLDCSGKAIEVKEKKRISNYCTLGAYYFKTCQLFKNLYDAYYGREQNLVNGEKYIAPLYNFLIENKGLVYIMVIDSSKVHVLGTPEELEIFQSL